MTNLRRRYLAPSGTLPASVRHDAGSVAHGVSAPNIDQSSETESRVLLIFYESSFILLS